MEVARYHADRRTDTNLRGESSAGDEMITNFRAAMISDDRLHCSQAEQKSSHDAFDDTVHTENSI